MKQLLLFFSSTFCLLSTTTFSQTANDPGGDAQSGRNDRAFWSRAGNTNQNGNNNILGTRWASDIWIMTNGIVTSRFTHNNAMFSFTGDIGDGLRILNTGANAAQGNLDLFTSNNNGQNETHARFGASGIISGQRNRFEVMGTTQMGMFYNVTQGSGIHRFSRLDQETGRIGTNNFWRIGLNPGDPVFGGVDAARRLEVLDATTQFRLTFSNSAAFTDFFSNSNGNLQIQPSGQRVGINASADPTANLDVFGNTRIRNVQAATPNSILIGVNANGSSDVNVRRLDFTGSSTQVLLGNGTWGNLPTFTPTLANNGVSRNVLFNGPYQLGDGYNILPPLFNTNTPLTTDRQIRLNGNDLIFSGNGNVGVGLVFPVQPTEKIDIDGNGRFRYLPDSLYMADSLVNKIVMVDSLGVLRWKSFVPSEFGAYCADTVNGKLDANKKVVLNNYKLYFTNEPDSMILGENRVGIGYPCGDSLPAKLAVRQLHDATVSVNTNAIEGLNEDVSDELGKKLTGVNGIAKGINTLPKVINRGGYFYASNAPNVIGVEAYVDASIQNVDGAVAGLFRNTSKTNNTRGIQVEATGLSITNYGIYSIARNGLMGNYGGQFVSTSSNGTANYGIVGYAEFNSTLNIGGAFRVGANPNAVNIAVSGTTQAFPVASYPSAVSIAVYGGSKLNNTSPQPSFAGYFDGNVFINGPTNGTGFATTTSDAQFKNSINNLDSASYLITQLSPKTFYFDTANTVGMFFSNKLQYGLIAQEVEPILPALVDQYTKPKVVDSTGVTVYPEVNYKTLNYSGLIPILVKSQQEQINKISQIEDSLKSKQNIIDSLKNNVNDLNNRLTNLENCLSALLPSLCQMNQSLIQNNTPAQQEEVRAQLSVRLANKEAIILDQNVPNPFAEQTVINFSIPATVQKAQIHFYDSNGKIIQSVDVVERGLGSLTVFGADLSTGIYTYTLVADGQIVATKRMMKE